jgi:epoxyqueuosine reductase QueG
MLEKRNGEVMLTALLKDGQADYLGMASLETAKDFIREQGGQFIADYPHCISLGIVLPSDVVDLLPRRGERWVQVSYRSHAYDVINQRLDLLASEITSRLLQAGYRAFPLPAAERVDDLRICGSFSHKLSANLCGHGWIGKSCLLVTEKHGPRVRWTTVLTDAPLSDMKHQVAGRCGTCSACVEACQLGAITGRSFSPE